MSMPKISAIDTVVFRKMHSQQLLEKSNEKTKKTLSLPLRDLCWNLRFLDPLGAGFASSRGRSRDLQPVRSVGSPNRHIPPLGARQKVVPHHRTQRPSRANDRCRSRFLRRIFRIHRRVRRSSTVFLWSFPRIRPVQIKFEIIGTLYCSRDSNFSGFFN